MLKLGTARLPAGVRLDPVTWPELCALVADGSEQALGALGRTPLQVWVGRAESMPCAAYRHIVGDLVQARCRARLLQPAHAPTWQP